ncbi:MAG: PD-(D/E)XK nuclease family protein, partial [Phycisphaerae bacterium]|nr:PD-(D/E)XK nuclease family protein [Phycisphaerae bacterium]
WAQARIAAPDESIRVVQDPADQADAVLDALAALEGKEPASSIAVGLADAELGPVIGQHLAAAGLALADPHARPLDRSGPCRLLGAVAALLQEHRFEDLLALVRHPDIEDWLVRRVGGDHDHAALLAAVDRVGVERLPQHWTSSVPWPRDAEPAMANLTAWLEPLGSGPRVVTQWVRPVLAALAEIYRGRSLDVEIPGDAEIHAALESLRESALAWLAPPGQAPRFEVSAAQAVGLLLQSVGQRSADPVSGPSTVEAYRWIELGLDDSPVVIVAGMNEGAVPRSHGADAFVPDQLRTALGMADSATRYAQDAHALSVLLVTRRRLALIAGQRGADGSPRTPSRLLLADTPQVVAERLLSFYPDQPEPSVRRLDARLRPGPDPLLSDPDRWPPPPPQGAACAEPIPVTAFRGYLACPYRFALRHALRVRPAPDPGLEMDGGAFGTLAHDVLKAWAGSDAPGAQDEAVIGRALSGHLDNIFDRAYGRDAAPALLVQREQLRRRLAAFARWQAGWAAEGWRIHAIELPVSRAELVGLSPPLAIGGQLDRVDVNERDGRWAVLDYKTADRGQSPDQAHRRSGEWVDLQLPLYRHLLAAAGLGRDARVELGYVVLSADPDEAGVRLADWSDEDLASADAKALEVGADIRARKFFPPGLPPRYDDYAALCGAEQFLELGPIDLEDEGGGG